MNKEVFNPAAYFDNIVNDCIKPVSDSINGFIRTTCIPNVPRYDTIGEYMEWARKATAIYDDDYDDEYEDYIDYFNEFEEDVKVTIFNIIEEYYRSDPNYTEDYHIVGDESVEEWHDNAYFRAIWKRKVIAEGE